MSSFSSYLSSLCYPPLSPRSRVTRTRTHRQRALVSSTATTSSHHLLQEAEISLSQFNYVRKAADCPFFSGELSLSLVFFGSLLYYLILVFVFPFFSALQRKWKMTSANDMGTKDFGPTEERLVDFYLRQKILGNDNEVSAIAEIGYICNYEPEDLPKLAEIRSDDTWYFFSPPDRKYRKSGNNNRVTRAGFWKVTGKKREIKNRKNQVIGFKRILVFYSGRWHDKVWTNWTIHEYHLNSSGSNERDYVLSRLQRKPPKKTGNKPPKKTDNSAVDDDEPGHDSTSEAENTLTDLTFPETAPQSAGGFLNSNGQDINSPIVQQLEMHMSQDPSYVNLQHTNDITDNYTMPLPQFDPIYQQNNNTEAVKLYPPIQDVQQLYSSMHAAPEESSLYGSLSSLLIGDIGDIEAVKAMADGCLPEMHLMQSPFDENFPFCENLQQTNCVADEDNLPWSQFGSSCQQDNILEVNSYPAIIEDAQSYCGSMQFSPSDSSPSESSGSQHVEDVNHTEAVNIFSPCCFETTLEVENEWLWDRLFEPGSAYFS